MCTNVIRFVYELILLVPCNPLNLKGYGSTCKVRMVWDDFRAIIRPVHLITIVDASKDASPDATLTVNGEREGRSTRSNAKRRATAMLMQGFISLMSKAH